MHGKEGIQAMHSRRNRTRASGGNTSWFMSHERQSACRRGRQPAVKTVHQHPQQQPQSASNGRDGEKKPKVRLFAKKATSDALCCLCRRSFHATAVADWHHLIRSSSSPSSQLLYHRLQYLLVLQFLYTRRCRQPAAHPLLFRWSQPASDRRA